MNCKEVYNMREEWRDIENYKGLYQVSNMGNVKSLERTVWKHQNRLEILYTFQSFHIALLQYLLFPHNTL